VVYRRILRRKNQERNTELGITNNEQINSEIPVSHSGALKDENHLV